MTPKQHWIVRSISLLVIAACCIKCGGTRETVINVPASSYTPSSYSHHLTAEEEFELAHPAPVGAKNLDGYFVDYQWWNRE